MNILGLIWFFLPAYTANMAPVLFRKLPFLVYPLDFGKTLNGKRIFGTNKTWRGLVVGTLAGTLVFYLQTLYPVSFEIFSYSATTIWLGFYLSLGALIGDAIKSFFKRQSGIAPGKPWYVVDQIDFPLGALLFSYHIYFPGFAESVVLVLLSFVLTVTVNHTSQLLNIRSVRW